MRTKELKKGVKYATENGTCVETGEVIERGWYRYRITKKDQKEKKAITKGLPSGGPENDPWTTNTRANSLRLDDGTYLRDIVEGVKVTVHTVDGEGNSTGTFESVVDPKIIKGTWEDYVRLHGDVLRSEAYKREAEEAAKAESLRLADKLKAAGLKVDGVDLRVTIQYMVDDRYHPGDLKETSWLSRGQMAKGYRLEPTLTATGETAEQLINAYLSDGH